MDIPLVSLQEVVRQQWFAPFWKISQEKKTVQFDFNLRGFFKKRKARPKSIQMSNAFCASKTVGDFSRDKDQILELTDQNSSLKVCIFLFECLHRAFDFFLRS